MDKNFKRPRFFGISAEPRIGKTTAIRKLAVMVKKRGLEYTGVAQPAIVEVRGKREIVWGYRLLDLVTGESRPFARKTKGDESGMGFRLEKEGFAWAAERIKRPAPLLLVDELGWVEARGKGHLPAIEDALVSGDVSAVVLTFRPQLGEAFVAKLNAFCGGEPRIWRLRRRKDEKPEEKWFEELCSELGLTQE